MIDSMKSLDKLLSISSHQLSERSENRVSLPGRLGRELELMLGKKNGFYAFQSALHVFPVGIMGSSPDLHEWNSAELWKSAFKGLADNHFCFAEDIFGGQFCVVDEKVYVFDPETAEIDYVSDSIESWAGAILGDPEFLTGWPLAEAWQKKYGALAENERLVPKTPFVVGGAFEVSNLQPCVASRGMVSRSGLALQIRDLPDGATLRFHVED